MINPEESSNPAFGHQVPNPFSSEELDEHGRFIPRVKSKKGVTQFVKELQVGEMKPIGEYKRSSLGAVATNLGYKISTRTGDNGTVYIQRLS